VGTRCLSLVQLHRSAPGQKTRIGVRSLWLWFMLGRASPAGKHPTVLSHSFEFTLKYFPQTRDKFKQTLISFVFKVPDLVPGVRPLLRPVPQSPPAPVLLPFHTYPSPFTFASGCTWKSNVKKKGLYQWVRAVIPTLQPLPRERPG